MPRGASGRPPRAGEPRGGARDGARAPGRRVGRGGRPDSLGHRRARSRARRRRRAGLAGADRRRSGHRQVHPAPPGLGRAGAVGGAGALRVGRGVGRAGEDAGGPARAWRRRSCSSWPRHSSRRSRRTWRRASRAALVVDSIQTVYLGDLESAPGSVTQVRECGGAADGARQEPGHRASSWSATSPRRARWPARACSSTWSTPCSTSRASGTRPTASCGR